MVIASASVKVFLKTRFFSLIATSFLSLPSAHAQSQSLYEKYKTQINNEFFKKYEMNINKLPLKGAWKHNGWSSDYMPAGSGGLIGSYDDLRAIQETEEIKKLKQEDRFDASFLKMKTTLVERLNPLFNSREPIQLLKNSFLKELTSIKFDLLNHQLQFPLTRIESQRIAQENFHYWAGMCNGWATAVALHPNLKDTKSNSPIGDIIFSTNDTAKLLTWYYFRNPPPAQMFDRLCNPTQEKNCAGMNPAVFHILMTNILGLQKDVVLSDIDAGPEVWNHPIVNFELINMVKINTESYEGLELAESYNIKYEKPFSYYHVKMNAAYIRESEKFNPQPEPKVNNYSYILKTDTLGNIVDGHAIQPLEFPDVIYQVKKGEPSGPWKKYFDLLEKNGT